MSDVLELLGNCALAVAASLVVLIVFLNAISFAPAVTATLSEDRSYGGIVLAGPPYVVATPLPYVPVSKMTCYTESGERIYLIVGLPPDFAWGFETMDRLCDDEETVNATTRMV